jgi:hypothetical protein
VVCHEKDREHEWLQQRGFFAEQSSAPS